MSNSKHSYVTTRNFETGVGQICDMIQEGKVLVDVGEGEE
jgi:hypothetical protein